MSRRSRQCFQTAWITGGSAGLGRAIAEKLAGEGIEVIATSRHPQRAKPIPGVVFVALDLVETESIAGWIDEMLRTGHRIPDLFINNAGSGVYGRLKSIPSDAWERQVAVLLDAPVALCREIFPRMVERGHGCIVNVASLATEFPLPFMHAYNLSKGGLSAFSRGLAMEAAGTGVGIVDFQPGDLRTRFNAEVERYQEAGDARIDRAWERLDAHLQSAPPPEKAARQLWKALKRGRTGTVTGGSFFQAVLGPLALRLFGRRWVGWFLRRYYRL